MDWRSALRSIGALSQLALVTLETEAQRAVTIRDPATCSSCRIELVRVSIVGDSTAPGLVNNQGIAATDSRGRVFITSNGDPGTIQVFSQSGRHLTRIGRPGRGPGEFDSRPLVVIGPRDSIFAWDDGTQRLTVFNPEFKLVRTVAMPMPFVSAAVLLPDGRAVVVAQVQSRDLIGFPLHLIDAAGTLVRSFGSRDQHIPRGSRWAGARVVTSGGDGQIWIARPNLYTLELWDTAGTHIRSVARTTSWFAPWERQPPGSVGETRMNPKLSGMWVRGDSLWVAITVDDAEWKPRSPVPYPGVPGARWTPDAAMHNIFDTIVEVIDLRTGSLIATERLRQHFVSQPGVGLLASYEEDAAGTPRYAVWRVELRH